MPEPTRMPRLPLAALLVATLTLAGCDLIGDVLEFGFWSGVVVVGLVVLVIWFGLRAFRR